jgi:cytochrome c oxidase subunit 2
MIVEVIGHRWWWEYRYPDSGIITANELVIPEDTNIRLEMRSEESGLADNGVLHSYWIPALAGKQDVIPGRVSTLNMRADEPGRYLGQCAEYCGLSHAYMRNRAVVLTDAEFDQWVGEQQAGSPVAAAVAEANPDWATNTQVTEVVTPDGLGDLASGSDPQQLAQGWASFQNNCAACHQIRTDGVASADDFSDNTGPNLTHLMSRKEFAGAIFDLYLLEDPDDPNGGWTDEPNVEQLTAWVSNAPEQKAMRSNDGIGMPSFATLPQSEIDALVSYLLTME